MKISHVLLCWTALLIGFLSSLSGATLISVFSLDSDFSDSLNSDNGLLSPIGGTGTFSSGAYLMTWDQGLLLNQSGSMASSWSLALQFSYDNVSGWKKILDVSAQASDDGFYLDSDTARLNWYPDSPLGNTVFSAATTYEMIMTFDGSTLNAYLDGSDFPDFSLVVPANAFVANDVSQFWLFQDDSTTDYDEDAAVALYEIRVWSGALTASEIPAAFSVIPEPGTFWLLGMGVLCLFFLRYRHHSADQTS